MKDNPDVSVVYEVVNVYGLLTVETSKTNEEDEDMKISEKEYQNTVLQKTFMTTWRSIYKVIDDPMFDERNIFHMLLKSNLKIIKISFYHLMAKIIEDNG